MAPRPKLVGIEEIDKAGRIYLVQNKPGLGGLTTLKPVTESNLKTYLDGLELTDSMSFQQHGGWIAVRSKYNSVTAIFVPADSTLNRESLCNSLKATVLIGRKVVITP